jgi:hypothetical protein
MSEDVSELTAKIDARQKSSQGDFMEYRLVVVHNGRRSKCWIRYSMMEQLHQRIKSDTRGMKFPRKLSCRKTLSFYSSPNTLLSSLGSQRQLVLQCSS